MQIVEKLTATVTKSIIWAFAGALYGGFFAGLLAYFHIVQENHWVAFIITSAIAGLVVAAFFGSMLVALGGTLTGILTAISYKLFLVSFDQPLILFVAAFILGLIAGSFFTKREIKQSQPLAQAASGLMAGLVAGIVVAFFTAGLHPDDQHWTVAAGSVCVVGLGYVFFIKNTPSGLKNRRSISIGGPVVTGIIAVAIASVFWMIGESYMSIPELGQVSRFQPVLDSIPGGLLGGALGGAFGGAMLEILGIQLEEHIY